LTKAGTNNKYVLTRLAIDRVRQLVHQKHKNVLNPSREKLPLQVLREIAQGKLSVQKIATNPQEGKTEESNQD